MNMALKRIGFILFVSACLLAGFSCNRGVGCPAQENLKTQVDKNGKYKAGKTKSGLWSKKSRKKGRSRP
jgi:hypothetical protein